MPITAVTTPISRHDQGERQAVVAEGRLAEDERGDEGHGVRLEEVGGHARAVADVVAHVVGDRGSVARVVLRDALLHLADEVGADVGGLGEDPAAHAHEHGDERRAQSESLQDLGRVGGVDEDDTGDAEQSEADRAHTDDTAGTERDPHRPVRDLGQALLRFARRRGGLLAAAATLTLARTASRMPM